MKASKIIEKLSLRYPKMGLPAEASDQFSTFDFENEHYLIEVKSRRKRYDPWLIERHKVDANILAANGTDQDVLYITECEGTAYVWNISKMLVDEYDFKWTQKNMPQTTDFSNNRWVKKDVGYVSESDATVIKL
jgi:hypothetical protein